MKKNNILFFIIIILFLSCIKENQNYKSFKDSKWNSEDVIGFNIEVSDSTILYNSNISIRHLKTYSFQNIIMINQHYFKENHISTDTIEILLSEDDGKWKGVGKSDIIEFTHLINPPNNYQSGIHSFRLELSMRDNNTTHFEFIEGVSDISFYLTKNNE